MIIDHHAKVYGLKIMNKSLNRGGHHLNTVSGEVRSVLIVYHLPISCTTVKIWSILLQVTDLRLSRSAGRAERPSAAQHRQSHLWDSSPQSHLWDAFSIPLWGVSAQSHLWEAPLVTAPRGMPLVKVLAGEAWTSFIRQIRDKTMLQSSQKAGERHPQKKSEREYKNIVETSTTSYLTLNPRPQNTALSGCFKNQSWQTFKTGWILCADETSQSNWGGCSTFLQTCVPHCW